MANHVDDKTFFSLLILWTVINGVCLVSVWALLIAILRRIIHQNHRRGNNNINNGSIFHLYLAFLLSPGAYYFLAMFLTDVYTLIYFNEHYSTVVEEEEQTANTTTTTTILMIRFSWWNHAYWWCASLWISFSVFVQMFKLLVATNNSSNNKHNGGGDDEVEEETEAATSYQPPTKRRVITDSMMIHVFSIGMATLFLGVMHMSPQSYGIFYWAFYMPVVVYVPTVLMTILYIRIRRDKLLQQQPSSLDTESQSLVKYFMRLFLLTYIMIIGVAVTLSLEKIYNIDLKEAIGCTLFDRLGLFQVCLALSKKDVRIAFQETWCCCCQRQNENNISSSKEEAADAMATTESMVVDRNEIEEGCLRMNEGRNGSISEV